MLFHFVADYLKHRLTAKSRHGTHSPFVYKLVDEVIYDFSDKKVYENIEKSRKSLLDNHSSYPPRKISRLIYRLTTNHPAKKIVTLGTGSGITTAYLSAANPDASILSIEESPEIAEIAYHNFSALGVPNIEIQVGNFDDLFVKEGEQLDLIYISGKHKKNALLKYFGTCLTRAHEGTLLILDNIYWSKEMKEAWSQIKANKSVTVTIDLFWAGLVYFRKGQVKEDFKIKF
ncbi:MAG: methyltransferase domain-containing protein [Pedobacter sp.]|nr:MAG: methyltransferase domain-containing protein [Pedobacter sp.]